MTYRELHDLGIAPRGARSIAREVSALYIAIL